MRKSITLDDLELDVLESFEQHSAEPEYVQTSQSKYEINEFWKHKAEEQGFQVGTQSYSKETGWTADFVPKTILEFHKEVHRVNKGEYTCVSIDVNDSGVIAFKAYTEKTSWVAASSVDECISLVEKALKGEKEDIQL